MSVKKQLGADFQVDDEPLIRLTIKEGADALDISGYTSLVFMFRKPSGEAVSKTATFSDDGSDGQVEYQVEAAFFNQPGTWLVQFQADTSGGKARRAEVLEFTVKPNAG